MSELFIGHAQSTLNYTVIDNVKIYYRNENELARTYSEIFLKNIYQLSFCNENKFVLDLGAHIGISALYLKKIWPNAKILSFEPNPYTFDVLKKNIAINKCDNVTLYNCAAYNQNQTIKLYGNITGEDVDSRGNSILSSWGKREHTSEIEVEAIDITDFAHQKIDFLKIDIEGAELIVLDALKPYLHNVNKIAVDCHAAGKENTCQHLNSLVAILTEHFSKIEILIKKPEDSLPAKWDRWIRENNVGLAYILASK